MQYVPVYLTAYLTRSPNTLNVHLARRVGCFYRREEAEKKPPGPHKDNIGTPLNEGILAKILPMYQRLAADKLLERCLVYLKQNANESLHRVIWRHCPKDSFGSKLHVEMAVDQSTCKYNAGTTVTLSRTCGESKAPCNKEISSLPSFDKIGKTETAASC